MVSLNGNHGTLAQNTIELFDSMANNKQDYMILFDELYHDLTDNDIKVIKEII